MTISDEYIVVEINNEKTSKNKEDDAQVKKEAIDQWRLLLWMPVARTMLVMGIEFRVEEKIDII